MDEHLSKFLGKIQKRAATGLPLAVAEVVLSLRATMAELKKTFAAEDKELNVYLHISVEKKNEIDYAMVACYDPEIGVEDYTFKSVVQLFDTMDGTGDVATCFAKLSESKHGQSVSYKRYCVDLNGPKINNERALLWDLAHGMERAAMATIASDIIAFLLEDVLPE